MALSQYVAINFLTKFDKKGLERATKELKGFDKVVATGAFRLKTFAKAGGIAAAAGMAIFAKNSIQAALAQERLDKQLQLTLRSIGQEFELPGVKTFIADLQRATNITDDQLVPALRQLITQTGDLDISQTLLSKSLDISAGTGADLNVVLDAINKAAIGNYKSITALGIGFTAAEVKSMGFVKLMQNLDKYAGSAEEQTKTFAGQLKSFQISAGQATKTLGEGFITSASLIATGSDQLDIFGEKLEVVATQFSDIMVGSSKSFGDKGLGGYLDVAIVLLQGLVGESTKLQELEKDGIKLRQQRILKEKGLYGLSGSVLSELEKQGKTNKKQLTYAEMLKKIQADILAREKNLTAEKRAQEALDKKKAELSAMFDIDKINLQAALSRKLSAEDELRVKLLQKLSDGTKAAVDEAARYADVLKVIEDGQITTAEVEMLAKKWGITTAEVLLYLGILFKSNEELRKMLALLDEINNKKLINEPIIKLNKIPAGAINPQDIFTDEAIGKDFKVPLTLSQQKYQNKITGERLQAQADAYFAANPQIDPFTGVPRMAEGGIVTKPTLAMIGEAGAEAVVPLDKMGGMGTTVNINVAGSVISEGQLQSVIQDALYNLNRSGAVTQLTNLGR
jgi:hypothetical protein